MIDRSPADVPVLDIEFPASHTKFRESDVSNMRDKVCRVLPSYEGMEIRVLLVTPNFSSFDAERSFLNLIKMINPDSINIEVDRKPHVPTDLYFSWIGEDEIKLRSLCFQPYNGRDEYVSSLAKFLKGSRLEHVVLRGVRSHIDEVVGNLPASIVELGLETCFLPTEGVLSLGDLLADGNGRKIRILSLFGCSAADLSFLPRVFEQCRSLVELNLQHVHVHGRHDYRHISCAALFDNPSLNHLTMYGAWVTKEDKKANRFCSSAVRKTVRCILAFSSRYVSRLGSRCVAKRLFRDVDRLVFSFLC